MKTFNLTIDVEPDATKNSWNTSNPISFRGVFEGIATIQELANQFGIVVTYFIQPVILFNDECVDFFKQLSGKLELATHLHGEYIGPSAKYPGPDFSGCNPGEKQIDYSEKIEYEKMKSLTDLFKNKFGISPKSFRAGRFGSSWRTLKILHNLGYSHDSSVIPRCKQYKSIKSPEPFVKNDIVEVPVTIDNHRRWLRPTPTYSSNKELKSIVQKGYGNLCSMIHNVEVIPACSPYCSGQKECIDMLDRMKKMFEYILEEQYVPTPLQGVTA